MHIALHCLAMAGCPGDAVTRLGHVQGAAVGDRSIVLQLRALEDEFYFGKAGPFPRFANPCSLRDLMF